MGTEVEKGEKGERRERTTKEREEGTEEGRIEEGREEGREGVILERHKDFSQGPRAYLCLSLKKELGSRTLKAGELTLFLSSTLLFSSRPFY